MLDKELMSYIPDETIEEIKLLFVFVMNEGGNVDNLEVKKPELIKMLIKTIESELSVLMYQYYNNGTDECIDLEIKPNDFRKIVLSLKNNPVVIAIDDTDLNLLIGKLGLLLINEFEEFEKYVENYLFSFRINGIEISY